MFVLLHKLYLLNYRAGFYGSKFGYGLSQDQLNTIWHCASSPWCKCRHVCNSSGLHVVHTDCHNAYRKHRPLLDHSYFAANTPARSASDQFFCFINLAGWMVNEFGDVTISPVREGDDPQAAIRTLLSTLGQLNFAVPPSCTASRLQAGAGREVCAVLNTLADWCLEKQNFTFEAPLHSSGKNDACVLLFLGCGTRHESFYRGWQLQDSERYKHESVNSPLTYRTCSPVSPAVRL